MFIDGFELIQQCILLLGSNWLSLMLYIFSISFLVSFTIVIIRHIMN